MTRYAAPYRALRSRKTAAVLICLLLLGGVFTITHTGPNKIANLAAVGVNSTQPYTPDAAGYQLGQFPTKTSTEQQHQTQPIATTDCTGDTYISAYGDTVCTSETSSTATAGATAPCTNGIKTSPYGDIVCRPTASHTTTIPICHPGAPC